MQKVMFKGLLPEEKTLREIKVTNGAKIMVVGSTINDVLAVNTPKDAAQQEGKVEESKKEPLCRQKQHRKVLDKGKPDDVMPSIKGVQEHLPAVPLSGMYNKSGGKVRLTFKLEQDQLWIGTKERRGDEFQDPDELFTRSAHIWHTHTHSAMSAPVLCARCPCAAHAPPAQRSHPALCQHAAKFAFRPPFLCWLSLSLCNIVSQSNCFHSVPCSPVASATDLFSALTKVHDVLSMF
uniref:UBFD1 PH-like C-terminal domain-containing protein n=1 Tax=Meleagris gallopavo TaxID=9103 RepID=G1N460_MELGA